MTERINYAQYAPEAMETMYNLERYIARCYQERDSFKKTLLDLIKLRVSQINGCAFCIDMHTKEARAAGETEQRLYGLNAWRETPYYTDKERAALAWAEANTLIAGNDIDDTLYGETREHFSEVALVDLTLAITTINSWNRIARSFRTEAGHYKAGNIAF